MNYDGGWSVWVHKTLLESQCCRRIQYNWSHFFNCIGFGCNTVYPWNFKSVVWTQTLHPPLHRHRGSPSNTNRKHRTAARQQDQEHTRNRITNYHRCFACCSCLYLINNLRGWCVIRKSQKLSLTMKYLCCYCQNAVESGPSYLYREHVWWGEGSWAAAEATKYNNTAVSTLASQWFRVFWSWSLRCKTSSKFIPLTALTSLTDELMLL